MERTSLVADEVRTYEAPIVVDLGEIHELADRARPIVAVTVTSRRSDPTTDAARRG